MTRRTLLQPHFPARGTSRPALLPVAPRAGSTGTAAAREKPALLSRRAVEPPAERREPRFVEVVVPASAVIGLQVDRTLSSETARLEDRVYARVTRDVVAGGRRAIPAGSRMQGSVILVERGGKMKDQARLGVRFHTLLLSDGTRCAAHRDHLRTAPRRQRELTEDRGRCGRRHPRGHPRRGKGCRLGGATGAAAGHGRDGGGAMPRRYQLARSSCACYRTVTIQVERE